MPLSDEAKARIAAAKNSKTKNARAAAERGRAGKADKHNAMAEAAAAVRRQRIVDGLLGDEPVSDPLAGVPVTGDIETDAKAELNALQQAYQDRAKREDQRFRLAVDSEYWVAVCFVSRADKEAFLRATGLNALGADKYLDGYAAADILNVDWDWRADTHADDTAAEPEPGPPAD
jgi:hypothetical protein